MFNRAQAVPNPRVVAGLVATKKREFVCCAKKIDQDGEHVEEARLKGHRLSDTLHNYDNVIGPSRTRKCQNRGNNLRDC